MDREITNAFQQIAQKEGTTVEQVRQEIQKSIDEAIKNPDPLVRERWHKIPAKGDISTPEEVIRYMVNQIRIV